jgi:hypothetical protein
MNNTKFVVPFFGLFLSAGLGACAHEQVLTAEQIAASEGPVRAAQEAGAAKMPTAALYLRLAEEEVIQSKSLAEKGNKRATTVLARAQADGELALALARQKTSEDEARNALGATKELDQEK